MPRVFYSCKKERPVHTEISLGNLQNPPMRLGEEKNLFALPRIELRILGMPAGSLGPTSITLYCIITFSNNPNLHYFRYIYIYIKENCNFFVTSSDVTFKSSKINKKCKKMTDVVKKGPEENIWT